MDILSFLFFISGAVVFMLLGFISFWQLKDPDYDFTDFVFVIFLGILFFSYSIFFGAMAFKPTPSCETITIDNVVYIPWECK